MFKTCVSFKNLGRFFILFRLEDILVDLVKFVLFCLYIFGEHIQIQGDFNKQ